METSENQKTDIPPRENKMIAFYKKHKKPLLIGISSVAAILLLCFLTNVIYNAILTSRVQSYLDGKMYLRITETSTSAYIFDGNSMGDEYWYSDSESPNGDMDNTIPYKVKGTLGNNELTFWIKEKGKWWSSIKAILCEDGTVEFTSIGTWKQTTSDEINTLQNQAFCKHQFGKKTLIRESTCTSEGETSQTCNKCGYTDIRSAKALGHNYKDKVCTVCGAEKQPLKAYHIAPNTWYVYNGVLHYQNCLIETAIPMNSGRAMTVQYSAVCQHCHAVEELSSLASPGVNYEVEKIHYCDACDGQTLVRLKIG